MPNHSQHPALALTHQWLETMVVGLNLCPFARPVLVEDTLHYAVCEDSEFEQLAAFFLEQLELIQLAGETEIATSLLVMPNGVADFYDYLDLVAECEYLLKRAGLSGRFQLASFHPGYLFDGVDADDVSHWSNRSPYPMLHIIREDQISRVLANFGDPELIPERNIALLRKLGKEGLIERFPPLADYC